MDNSLIILKAFSTVSSPSGLTRQHVAGDKRLRDRRKSRSIPFPSRAFHISSSLISREPSPSFSKGSKFVGTIPHTRVPPRSRNLRMEEA